MLCTWGGGGGFILQTSVVCKANSPATGPQHLCTCSGTRPPGSQRRAPRRVNRTPAQQPVGSPGGGEPSPAAAPPSAPHREPPPGVHGQRPGGRMRVGRRGGGVCLPPRRNLGGVPLPGRRVGGPGGGGPTGGGHGERVGGAVSADGRRIGGGSS